MGIKTGNIDNEGGKAKMGHTIEGGEVDSETLDIETGDIVNKDGDLNLGHTLKGVKAKNKWVWGIVALGAVLSPLLSIYFNAPIPPVDELKEAYEEAVQVEEVEDIKEIFQDTLNNVKNDSI